MLMRQDILFIISYLPEASEEGKEWKKKRMSVQMKKNKYIYRKFPMMSLLDLHEELIGVITGRENKIYS